MNLKCFLYKSLELGVCWTLRNGMFIHIDLDVWKSMFMLLILCYFGRFTGSRERNDEEKEVQHQKGYMSDQSKSHVETACTKKSAGLSDHHTAITAVASTTATTHSTLFCCWSEGPADSFRRRAATGDDLWWCWEWTKQRNMLWWQMWQKRNWSKQR